MSQATPPSEPYVNSNLFSGYYLDNRIDDLDAWDCDEQVRAAFDELRELWALEGDLVDSYKEDELLDSWIDEVLAVLGFGTLSETTLPDGGGYNDRLLFESDETRRDAAMLKKEGDPEATFGLAAAILEAKRWDADFTRRFTEDRSYRDASHQIKYYLERTPERLKWGILTDGRKWRLYGTKDYATETYYEVDLPELLTSGNLAAFKYFYVFFRPAAFRETAGTSFLDTVWNESETAAQELGEDLQDNVFTALRVLGEGFLETNGLDIDPKDERAREELKEQSLVLLYRLMFVLYAESRNLIHPDDPDSEDHYRANFSLDQLRLEIHERIESGDSFEDFSEFSTSKWGQLQDLFRLVDTGQESLGIPPYNGGLFDDDKHSFLADHQVSDRYIAEVIYRLGTTETGDGSFVLADYADLDTRHLGSIYEGLLEHEFHVAPEQYAAVAADGGQVWEPATEVSVADAVETVERGELYVVNDDGERKATGAYYTPDYVVTYIVEETVDPLLEDIDADLRADGLEPSDREYFMRFWQRVQKLKILDPAMGSGHFLTKATGYLTEQVMKVVREQELQSYDEQEFRRDIAKECIYGVDVNGMAVELAKLSMWLETLATDQPLAFLDHHMKSGNSLVGSDITEVLSNGSEKNGGQITLTQAFAQVRERTLEHVMELMEDLLAIENKNLEEIESMEAIYEEIRADPLYKRLFEMANVHTAERFGLDVPTDAYEEMAQAIEDEDGWEEIREEDWFYTAQVTASEESFFHWELEFPEVFFGGEGKMMESSGFDAVVGNPPYVNISSLSSTARAYLSSAFPRIYAGNSDLLYYFMGKSVDLLRHEGMSGLIISQYFTSAQFAEGLRESLLADTRIAKIVDFENFQAFPGVDILADIVICQRDSDSREYDVTLLKLWDDDVSIDQVSSALLTEDSDVFSIVRLDATTLSPEPWNLLDGITLSIKQKMEDCGWKLGRYYEIAQSMQTGHNEALVVDGETIQRHDLEEDIIKKLAKTKNVRRYLIKDLGEYVLWTEVDDIDQYPNVKEYLSGYKEELEDRYDIKARDAQWWRISNPRNVDLFSSDNPRILTPFMSTTNKFAIDTEQRFNDGGDIRAIFESGAPVDMRYTLAVMNSVLGEFYHKNTAKLKRDGYYEYYGNALEKFPVFDISPTDSWEQAGVEPPKTSHVNDRKTPHDFLAEAAENMRQHRERRHALNLDLPDHLGAYSDGPTLSDIGFSQPPENAADSILNETTEQKPNLRVGEATVARESPNSVEIRLTARYKPDDETDHETGPYGYTETEPLPALRITDLTETEADLIEAFVPVAVDEAGGFADFRKNATKTNSLIDRLRALTLPRVDDVRDGLADYIETKERAEELEAKIERTDDLIDDIVYELYGLTDEEIEIVEQAVSD
jgi:hypothetical protein